MKYSHKLSDAIHILAYLEIYKDGDLSSKAIANSVEANPSVVRSIMSDLRKAGLISSRQGVAGAALAKPTDQINLLEVYQAINTDHHLLHIDTKTNPQCIVGGNIQETLNQFYQQIQDKAADEMKEITLQNVIDDIMARHSAKN